MPHRALAALGRALDPQLGAAHLCPADRDAIAAPPCCHDCRYSVRAHKALRSPPLSPAFPALPSPSRPGSSCICRGLFGRSSLPVQRDPLAEVLAIRADVERQISGLQAELRPLIRNLEAEVASAALANLVDQKNKIVDKFEATKASLVALESAVAGVGLSGGRRVNRELRAVDATLGDLVKRASKIREDLASLTLRIRSELSPEVAALLEAAQKLRSDALNGQGAISEASDGRQVLELCAALVEKIEKGGDPGREVSHAVQCIEGLSPSEQPGAAEQVAGLDAQATKVVEAYAAAFVGAAEADGRSVEEVLKGLKDSFPWTPSRRLGVLGGGGGRGGGGGGYGGYGGPGDGYGDGERVGALWPGLLVAIVLYIVALPASLRAHEAIMSNYEMWTSRGDRRLPTDSFFEYLMPFEESIVFDPVPSSGEGQGGNDRANGGYKVSGGMFALSVLLSKAVAARY
ncbi:unnamed protein product [Ostreobium quekettii]|uniref:Uncharacterized protein n=1 Tax=Ostreobium quekettii TaxID=121088 RepID=A0A8S1ITR6_9CHLO|nr:unnamed protein product [Ostreobium quekettii]